MSGWEEFFDRHALSTNGQGPAPAVRAPSPLDAGSFWDRLRAGLQPNEGTQYGSVLPFAQDWQGTRWAMPSIARDLAIGAVDLVNGTNTGEVTPEATMALGGWAAPGAAMRPTANTLNNLVNPQQLGRMLGETGPYRNLVRPQAEEGFINFQRASQMVDRAGIQGRPLRYPDEYTPAEFGQAWRDITPEVYTQTHWMPWLRGTRWAGADREWLFGLNPELRGVDARVQRWLGNPTSPFAQVPGSTQVGNLTLDPIWGLRATERGTFTQPLISAVDDPSLFIAAPRLRQVSLEDNVGPSAIAQHGNRAGGWYESANRIERNTDLPSTWTGPEQDLRLGMIAAGLEARRTLAHEGQHGLQSDRGITALRGGDPATVEHQIPPNIWAQYMDNHAYESGPASHQAYQRLPGEWEARFAEAMLNQGRVPTDPWNDLPDWRLIRP